MGEYRYGFNGKENDNEVKGEGNQQDYGMRIYDPRVGKFLSVDPLTQSYPWYTPYQFAGNKPIIAVDLDGAEEFVKTSWVNLAGEIVLTTLNYDETAKPLPHDLIHQVYNYEREDGTWYSYKTDVRLNSINFLNSNLGYNNENTNGEFVLMKPGNPFLDPKGHSLFWEFYNGTGSENTVITGGEMIEEIKKMESFQDLKKEGFKKWSEDNRLEEGETFLGAHHMNKLEGLFDLYLPSVFSMKGEKTPVTSTQHFLGSYTMEMTLLDKGKTILYTVADSKSFESFTDHQNQGNSSLRRPGNTALGNTYQRYMWIEKVDPKEVDKATHCTVCGKKI